MPHLRFLPGLLALVLVAGCSNSGGSFDLGSTTINNGALTVRGDHVTLRPDGMPDAKIDAGGSFSVDGKPVAVTPAQRVLLKRYYQSAAAVRQHGIETGKAGIRVAGAALEDVASSLFHGDARHIDKKVDAQTAAVTQAANKICTDVADIRIAQDALAAQMPAFKPYAQLITPGSAGNCHEK